MNKNEQTSVKLVRAWAISYPPYGLWDNNVFLLRDKVEQFAKTLGIDESRIVEVLITPISPTSGKDEETTAKVVMEQENEIHRLQLQCEKMQRENERIMARLRRYVKAMDDIYNAGDEAREAVIKHFGVTHNFNDSSQSNDGKLERYEDALSEIDRIVRLFPNSIADAFEKNEPITDPKSLIIFFHKVEDISKILETLTPSEHDAPTHCTCGGLMKCVVHNPELEGKRMAQNAVDSIARKFTPSYVQLSSNPLQLKEDKQEPKEKPFMSKSMQKRINIQKGLPMDHKQEAEEVGATAEDPSDLVVEYAPNTPEGCPPFDVIKANLVNALGKKIELHMTPDEALLLANNLIGASMDALLDDENFVERFVSARRKWVAMKQREEK